MSSANCQGLRDLKKRVDVINYLKETKSHIICLQDTHLNEADTKDFKKVFGGTFYLHGHTTNSRGVAVLFANNFDFKINAVHKDKDGNYLNLQIEMYNLKINLITIYAPNVDNPNFFRTIENLILHSDADYNLLCGDFNLVLDPSKDAFNYHKINNPNSRQSVLEIMNANNLIDIFRLCHPNDKRYTWRRKNPIKQARLDYFLISNSMFDLINTCNIKPGYRSDHSIIQLEIEFSKFQIGKGIWKFNTSLLSNQDYLKIIKKVINEEKVKYALPIYQLNYIEDTSSNEYLQFVIDEDTFLELLFLRIRGETIKFSSVLKKNNNSMEKALKEDIEYLETHSTYNDQILNDKKQELQNIREHKLKGEFVRSRLKWISDGEKPSKYFCGLEKKNYTEKTIRKLELSDKTVIMDQKLILKNTEKFYANLFKDRNCFARYPQIEKDIEILLNNNKKNTVKNVKLGQDLKIYEISQALKSMKNNKTPGIDGIPTDFLKVFWFYLKHFIQRSLNCCFRKGKLSYSMRQAIIICLPKDTKDRRFLKNWRPISLLCVTYKLALTVIANRMKPYIDKIVSKSQTGFLSGRNISESTRLIYDIMHYTEVKKINGILLLIDFAKAFDSISWTFIYKILSYFGFDDDLLKWIKMFNVLDSCQTLSILKKGAAKEIQFHPTCSYLLLKF